LEADWEIEIGGDAPTIDIAWHGLVDLRRAPEAINTLPEVALLPCLAPALVRLNAPESALYTVKCDVWQVDAIDPFEFDAEPECATRSFACYIDLLPRNPQDWPDHETAGAWCKRICAALRSAPLRCCRSDLVVRRAIPAAMEPATGVTAYLAACGPDEASAKAQLEAALVAFTDVLRA